MALDYLVHHHEAAKATDSYAALSRAQVALVADEACAALQRMVTHIRRMAALQPLPDPAY